MRGSGARPPRPRPGARRCVSRRTAPSSPSQTSASPARVPVGAGLRRRARIVERAAAPPARPGRPAARVEHLARPPLPRDPDVVRGRAPEPARVGDRAGLERVERRLAGRAQEPRQARLVEQLGRRPPRGIRGIPAEDRPGGVAGHAGSLARLRRHVSTSSTRSNVFWRGRNRLGRGGSPKCVDGVDNRSSSSAVGAVSCGARARGGTDDRGAGSTATATRRGRRRPGFVADAAQPVPPDRDPERGRDRDDPSGVAPDPRRDRRRGARRPGDRPVPRRRRGHRRRRRAASASTRTVSRSSSPWRRPNSSSTPAIRSGTSASAATTSCSARSAARRS